MKVLIFIIEKKLLQINKKNLTLLKSKKYWQADISLKKYADSQKKSWKNKNNVN